VAKEIKVDIVADASKFEAAMKRADAAAGKFEATNKDLAESFDNGETKLMGTADLLDGLATTMGLNIDGAISMSRGFADMASGIKTTVIPALEGSIAKMKALSSAMVATPWRRFALGAGLAVGATVAVVASTDEGQQAFSRMGNVLKTEVNAELERAGHIARWADGMIGGLGSKVMNLVPGFKAVDKAAQEATARLAIWTAQAAAAARAIALANQFGGTVDDPDGAFASAAAIEALNSSTDQSLEAQIASFAPKVEKAAKATKTGVDKIAKAARDAFQKQLPKLQAAAEKFTDAMSLKTALRGNFGLGFGDDLGHNVTESLHRQVAQFKEFVRKLAALRKMGLPESLARQFADAGPAALDEMNRINSGNIGEIKKLAREAGQIGGQFSTDETIRRTGVDPNKPVTVVIDVRGGDGDLKNMIKKWVRTDGGGKVEVAFR
jgi:hypothetical protein